MKKFYPILISLLLLNCSSSKPKTVFICGDHECINKKEAKQYFEDNLSLEVKIVNKKDRKNIDLVELNLDTDNQGKKQINIFKKDETDKPLKKLTKLEIKSKKKELKKRKKVLKDKKELIKKKREKQKKISKSKKNNKKRENISKKTIHNSEKQFIDVCKIINECNIEEISKYLLKQGIEKDFPDITTREL